MEMVRYAIIQPLADCERSPDHGAWSLVTHEECREETETAAGLQDVRLCALFAWPPPTVSPLAPAGPPEDGAALAVATSTPTGNSTLLAAQLCAAATLGCMQVQGVGITWAG